MNPMKSELPANKPLLSTEDLSGKSLPEAPHKTDAQPIEDLEQLRIQIKILREYLDKNLNKSLENHLSDWVEYETEQTHRTAFP
ncbi:MAG: hypothetical protein GXO90_11510 [FCB group bacterium]|nr:hypothetical protein [FCB group bacterium]